MHRRRHRKKNRIILKATALFLCLIVLTMSTLNKTLSKYESETEGQGEIEAAFYLLKESTETLNINLFSMVPQALPYVKTFTVSNNDGTKRTETSLEYSVQIVTTTNLPLTYELYINQNYNDIGAIDRVTTKVVEQDANGTYFQTINTAANTFTHTTDVTNTYYLVIYFPLQYKTVEYQNIIESIEIKINSKQII